MAEWTLDQAMELALTDIEAAEQLANVQAVGEAVSGVTRAGVTAAAMSDWNSEAETTTSTSTKTTRTGTVFGGGGSV